MYFSSLSQDAELPRRVVWSSCRAAGTGVWWAPGIPQSCRKCCSGT